MMRKPPLDSLAVADAVFEGRAVRRSEASDLDAGGPPSVTYEFAVLQSWKGEPGPRALVTTATDSAACGRSYELGETYLIYAYAHDDALHDGLCSRSQIRRDADEDLAALGPGAPPKGAPASDLRSDEPREPPRIEPSAEAPPPAAEPRGCTIAGPSAPALGLLVLALAIRARRRRPG